MGAGKSRSRNLYKTDGGTVTLNTPPGFEQDNESYSVGKSWDELIAEANEENNFFNVSALELLQEGGFYAKGSRGRDKYFDEDSLYIANQLVEAWNIQHYATGGVPEYMYSAYKGGEINNIVKARSKIGIDVDNEISLTSLAERNGSAFAVNRGGQIEMYTVIYNRRTGQYIDLRNPKQAEKKYKEGYASGWSSTDSTVGTILHEYGHSVQRAVEKLHPNAYKKFMKETGNGTNQYVSGYASSYNNGDRRTACSENFAEAYSAYVTGTPLPTKKAEHYYSSFKTLMKSAGIKEGNRSTSAPKSVSSASSVRKTILNGNPNNAPKVTSTPKSRSTTTKSTTTKERFAKNFNSSSNSISGTIRGKSFSATLTDGIKKRGYIERTVGNTKYRIDISTGSFTKV